MQGAFSFPMAQGRAEALGEIHARPHLPVGPDRAIIQLAFLTEGARSFYGQKPILSPEDLEGVKVRVRVMSLSASRMYPSLVPTSATVMAASKPGG